jgi:branched-chain amino acid transport system substrate-binding protein
VHFELVGEDDAADPRTSTVVAQKFADTKVNGVVGHLNSGTTIPASRIYAEAGIPQVSPSATNPKYTHQGFKTAFRVMANDEQQGRVLGQFAVGPLKAKTIAVIDDATAYGQGLADEFEKAAKAAGAKIVGREHTDDHSTDFSAILIRVKGMHPDLVFFGGMDAQSGPMIKQIKTLKLGSAFLTGDGGCSAEFAKLGAEAAEGSYCSLPGVPLEKMPKGADFKQRFNAKYGTIQDYAPYAYDAVGVMVAAMKAADSAEPAKYLPQLAKIHYAGVTYSDIAFDGNGDLKGGQVTVYQWKKGERVAQ